MRQLKDNNFGISATLPYISYVEEFVNLSKKNPPSRKELFCELEPLPKISLGLTVALIFAACSLPQALFLGSLMYCGFEMELRKEAKYKLMRVES